MGVNSLTFTVSFVLATLTCVSAICNQCGSASGVMCTSFNSFMFCDSGVAYGTNVTCPSYTACSDTAEVCTSPSIAYDCAPTCGTCSTDGRFACLNSTAYALCFGGTTPSSSAIGTCATGMFCDITVTAPPFCSTNPASICTTTTTTATTTTAATTTTTAMIATTASSTPTTLSTSTTTASTSTASTSTASTTTPSTTTASTSTASTTTPSTTTASTSTASTTTPSTTTASTSTASTSTASTSTASSTTTVSAPTYCTQINARDKTRYAAPYPTNCKSYAYCFVLAGNLTGSYYFCPGSTIFNNQSGYCVASTSYTCPAGQ